MKIEKRHIHMSSPEQTEACGADFSAVDSFPLAEMSNTPVFYPTVGPCLTGAASTFLHDTLDRGAIDQQSKDQPFRASVIVLKTV